MGANNYRLKDCKRCGTPHKKQGPYCSQSCGNVRSYTEDARKLRSIQQKEYYETPEGAATVRKVVNNNIKKAKINQAKANGEYILQPDDYAVQIPNLDDDDKIIW